MRSQHKKTGDTTLKNNRSKNNSLSARWRKTVLVGMTFFALGPAVAPLPPTPAPMPTDGNATLPLPNRFSTQLSSTTCIPAATIIASKDYPQIRPVFERMARQPISGAPIIARVTTPTEDVDACISRSLPDGNLIAAYESQTRRLIVAPRNVAPSTVIHEVFHTNQHLTGGFTGTGSNRMLSTGDRATGLLLIEASAAAYALVVIKEASLTDASYAHNMRTHDYGMTRTFNTAFDASYTANKNTPETERRRAALQAGGQAVVLALMSGHSSEWKAMYRPEAMRYFGITSYTGQHGAEYMAERDRLYARIGHVATDLQLIPGEFFGLRAQVTIAATHRAFQFPQVRVITATTSTQNPVPGVKPPYRP